MITKKTALLLTGLALVTLLGLALWFRPQPQPPTSAPQAKPKVTGNHEEGIRLNDQAKKAIGLQTEPVTDRRIEDILTINGMIQPLPDRLAWVSSRLPGKVVNVKGNLGDQVRAGQMVVEIRSTELERLEIDLHHAHTKLARAQADLERVRQLVELKIGAQKDLLDRETEVHNLEREMAGLESQLRIVGLTERQITQVMQGNLTDASLALTAPMGGLIIERNVTLGEVVAPDKPLFTIADLQTVLAEGDAFEPSLAVLRKGLPVRVTVAAYPTEIFTGKIGFVSFVVDPEKRTIHFRAEVRNTKDFQLRPNMFAKIAVVAGTKAQALAVPLEAVITEGEQDFVFVENGDHYLKTSVLLGVKDDRYAEVKDGLVSGDLVVTVGKRQLYAVSRTTGKESGDATGGHGH